MKKIILFILIFSSYFTFSQSAVSNVLAISTNHFSFMSSLNDKDSVVLIHDLLGNIIEEKYFEDGNFVNFSIRKINKYNQNLKTQTIELQLNNVLNVWDTVFKKDFYYASNDSLERVISSKKINNTWVYAKKRVFQYDEHYRMLVQIDSDWDISKNKFISKLKEFYTYNTSNQIEKVNRQVCNLNGNWLNTGKDSIIFQNGLKVEKISFYYDDSNHGQWIKTSKETIMYDNLNNHVQTLIQHFQPEQDKFVTNEYTSLITFHYSQNKRLSLIDEKIFNPSLNKFVDFEQKFYY